MSLEKGYWIYYKCRRCGKLFSNKRVPNYVEAIRLMVEGDMTVHNCNPEDSLEYIGYGDICFAKRDDE